MLRMKDQMGSRSTWTFRRKKIYIFPLPKIETRSLGQSTWILRNINVIRFIYIFAASSSAVWCTNTRMFFLVPTFLQWYCTSSANEDTNIFLPHPRGKRRHVTITQQPDWERLSISNDVTFTYINSRNTILTHCKIFKLNLFALKIFYICKIGKLT